MKININFYFLFYSDTCYIFVVNMEKLLSDAKIKRLERWREIKAYYKELRLAGTKKTVAIHETMKNFGVSTLTVYKAIKLKEEK